MGYGKEIEVNGKRPAWLANDDMCQPHAHRIRGSARPVGVIKNWDNLTKIHLPADHWAYPVLEQGYWPWAGGDKAPDDWDGGDVLLRGGSEGNGCHWDHGGDELDIIGYKREVGSVSADVQYLHGEQYTDTKLTDELMELRQFQRDAIAKYPDLALDPDQGLKDEVLAFAKEHGWEHHWRWVDTDRSAPALLYAWAKRHPTPGSKPCALTPEELAQWRLEQARLAVIATGDWNQVAGMHQEIVDGKWDTWVSVRSALAVLKKYNITPETGK